jgi:hypothetical protein
MNSLANISRRQLLGILASSFLLCLPYRASDANTQIPAFTLDVFLYLSRILTGADKLDAPTAQRFYDLFAEEPWGKEHLAQVAEKLKLPQSSIEISKSELKRLLDFKMFSNGERWFINHFLTTWMTGIYYHQVGDKIVTYQKALMFTALDGIRPSPGVCSGKFGYWSEAPRLGTV